MIYFGTRLSDNISRREPEGYLICLNVPVARTGTQDYLPSELGLPLPDDRLIPVRRPPEEVFSPAAVASFEGMPVTDDHPSAPDGVTAENIARLQKGHAHNVRRAAPPDDDLLLADLIITDPTLIQEVLAGKREISCGYNYVLCEEGGTYLQREIRGNHVAVVDIGRAGPRVSIQDQDPQDPSGVRPPSPEAPTWPLTLASTHPITQPERSRSRMTQKQLCTRMLARMARDGDKEGMNEILEELLGEDPAGAGAAPNPGGSSVLPAAAPAAAPIPAAAPASPAMVPAAPAVVPAAPAAAPAAAPVVIETPVDQPVIVDCGPQILEALQQIISLLSAASTAASSTAPTADCEGPRTPAPDEAPSAAAQAVAETAASEMAENVLEAAMEAVAGTIDPNLTGDDVEEDPVDALVAEILESAGPGEAGAEAEEAVAGGILSSVLEPLPDEQPYAPDPDDPAALADPEDPATDSDDPEDSDAAAQAADALRAALSAFRPRLRQMSPRDRQRFNADVAARMSRLTRRATRPGRPNPYAAIRTASPARDANSRSLGQKIMAARNANLKK